MMDNLFTDEKVERTPESKGEELWPREMYRAPDERAKIVVWRKLWPRDEYRPENEWAGHEIERLLYPLDELRPPKERAGHQIERHLWTRYQES